jgi:hypothetical protein
MLVLKFNLTMKVSPDKRSLCWQIVAVESAVGIVWNRFCCINNHSFRLPKAHFISSHMPCQLVNKKE